MVELVAERSIVRPLNCQACGDPVRSGTDNETEDCCDECFAELFLGIIAPPYGPLEDETPDDDDDLDDLGRRDNAVRAMEDTGEIPE